VTRQNKVEVGKIIGASSNESSSEGAPMREQKKKGGIQRDSMSADEA